MNTIEYCNYSIDLNEHEFKETINKSIKLMPNVISVLPSFTKLARTIVPEYISLSTVIDYPFGCNDLKSRLLSTENAIKNGSTIVELVAPSFLLCNRKYDKFREDVASHLELCSKLGCQLRYILEYRVFTPELLCKVAQILLSYKVDIIYPSTGHLLDDISDNILASALINKKVPDINIVINGNIWNSRHTDIIASNKNIYGCKTSNIHSLSNLLSTNK
jgi:deoxyribose-phosphate aldolase